LGFVLGDSPSGRLYKALVEPGLASNVSSFTFRLPEPSLLLTFARLPEDGDIDEARRVMLDTLAALESTPPTVEEVQRAVNSLTSSMERTLNDSSSVGIGLSEWAATGDWRMLFLHRDRLEQVTVDDVIAAADTYLVRDNQTLGTFIPDEDPRRVEIPAAPAADVLLADYTGREQRSEGEAFEATPENIEDRVQRFTLANGAEVALLPKATRGERVRGFLTMRMGNEAALTGLGTVPSATASMLSRGTENFSRQDIQDRIDELQAGLNVGGSRSLSASVESTRENLLPVVDLLAEIARRPTFPESELEEYKRQALTSLAQQRDDPGSVANRALSRHQNTRPPEHPAYIPSFEEQRERIETLTVEDLRDFHQRFYGFGPGTTVAFVGDFDPDELRRRLESHFGAWSAEEPFERWENEFEERPAERMVLQLDDKANALLLGTVQMPLTDTDPDYPALQLAGHMMGGGFLSSRLGDRIRNEEGLSYSVGGNFSAHPIDESGSFFVFAAFAPENRERLETVLQEELVKATEQGFTAEELESARAGFLRQQVLMRSDDARLASLLSSGLYLDRDLFFQAEREARLAEITVDEVNAAIAEWLDPNAVSYAIAGDFTMDQTQSEAAGDDQEPGS